MKKSFLFLLLLFFSFVLCGCSDPEAELLRKKAQEEQMREEATKHLFRKNVNTKVTTQPPDNTF